MIDLEPPIIAFELTLGHI